MTTKRQRDQSAGADDVPMSIEELARRMLTTPHKERAEMVKKKAKPRTKRK